MYVLGLRPRAYGSVVIGSQISDGVLVIDLRASQVPAQIVRSAANNAVQRALISWECLLKPF